MGWAILADADRIMRPYVENRLIHQRCQADRATRIIGEDQKSGREGPQPAERHAADGGAHGMLTNAKVKISAAIVAETTTGLEVPGKFEGQTGLGTRGKISRATHQPWHSLGHSVQNLA